VPPDLRESQRRFEAAAKSIPRTPTLRTSSATPWTTSTTARLPQRRSRRQSPEIRRSRWRGLMKGRERIYLDDVPGAVDAYAQCLKVSPCSDAGASETSPRCKGTKGAAVTSRPRAAASSPSRRTGCLVPETGAGALRGRADDRSRPWGARAEVGTPPRSREKWEQPHDEASLAILTGHFDDAERWLDQLDRSFGSDPEERIHTILAYDRHPRGPRSSGGTR